MWLFLAFLAVPLIEIALFIQVGGLIGLWPTLAVVVLTAVAGTWLVRSQGRMALGRLQNSFQTLDNPAEPLAHGAMILVSGALLLTPGFFTDAVGFALLVPGVREVVFRYIAARMTVNTFQMGGQSHRAPQGGPMGGGPIIDGEFEEVRPEPSKPSKPSGWVSDQTRH